MRDKVRFIQMAIAMVAACLTGCAVDSTPANQPPQKRRLPNYEGGPLRPLPAYVNYYSIKKAYPEYLLCSYSVDETNYVVVQESAWFKASLEQIRKHGRKKFPEIRWVAVIISNRAEHKGAATFEQSHRVGKIFTAGEVFERRKDLSEIIVAAVEDRHPLKYDRQQPTPGEQERWIMVESHATGPDPD